MKLTSDIIRKLIGEELEKSLLTELDKTQEGMVDSIVDILRQTYEINPASVTTILSTVKTNLSKPPVDEKLDKDATAGEYVKDFRMSDAPQFKGKSKKKKQQMAMAAYLDAQDD
jgi:predicted RNA methylase